MSNTERILLLLEIAGAGGLSSAIIGDIVGLASHELEPILFRLVEHGHVVSFFEGEWTRRRPRYRLADQTEWVERQPATPRWVPSVPRWIVRT
jgi:hypothetical protein